MVLGLSPDIVHQSWQLQCQINDHIDDRHLLERLADLSVNDTAQFTKLTCHRVHQCVLARLEGHEKHPKISTPRDAERIRCHASDPRGGTGADYVAGFERLNLPGEVRRDGVAAEQTVHGRGAGAPREAEHRDTELYGGLDDVAGW